MNLEFSIGVRLTHFFNFLFLSILIRSGIEILGAHPKLYWRDRPGASGSASRGRRCPATRSGPPRTRCRIRRARRRAGGSAYTWTWSGAPPLTLARSARRELRIRKLGLAPANWGRGRCTIGPNHRAVSGAHRRTTTPPQNDYTSSASKDAAWAASAPTFKVVPESCT
jgi:hypothetical protein